MPRQRASAGDRLKIEAADWNAVLDLLGRTRPQQLGSLGGTGGTSTLTPALEVLVRNDTGGDLSRGAIVALGDPVTDADGDPFQFQGRPAFSADTPTGTDDAAAILSEPIADGAIGRAIIAGPVVCSVDVTDTGHGYAAAVASDTGNLASGGIGPARILWRATGSTGEQDCVVWLAGAGVTASSLTQAFSGARRDRVSSYYEDLSGGLYPAFFDITHPTLTYDEGGYTDVAYPEFLFVPEDGYYEVGGSALLTWNVDLGTSEGLTLSLKASGGVELRTREFLESGDQLGGSAALSTIAYLVAGTTISLRAAVPTTVPAPGVRVTVHDACLWATRLSGPLSNGEPSIAGGTVTSVTAGSGLDGGTITTSGTISLPDTGVTPGSYTAATITVDAKGRLTAASSGATGFSSYGNLLKYGVD